MLLSEELLSRQDPQIIYDCYFMSLRQFVKIYNRLYREYLPDLDHFWHSQRSLRLPYHKKYKETSLPESFEGLKKKNPQLYTSKLRTWETQEKKARQKLEHLFKIKLIKDV